MDFRNYKLYRCVGTRIMLVSWNGKDFYDEIGNHFYKVACTPYTGFVTTEMVDRMAEVFIANDLWNA